MKVPLILITYGFSRKLCTWEEEGVHKLPFFGEPVLAAIFVKSFNAHMGPLLQKDQEMPQIQVCEKARYALDMLRVIGMVSPEIIIVYNAAPIGEDPHEAISKVSEQFQDVATVINKEYSLEEATEIFQQMVDELEDPAIQAVLGELEEGELEGSDSEDEYPPPPSKTV